MLATWGLAPGMQSYLLALDPEGPTPQKILAKLMGVNPANVSRGLNSLAHKGLVLRRYLPGSLRDYSVELTSQGLLVRKDLEARARGLVEGFSSRLEPKDWVTLVRLLEKVAEM